MRRRPDIMQSDILLWSKNERETDMDNEKAGLVLSVIGQAVVDLIVGQIPITKDSVLKRLEHNQKYVGNVIEKGAHQEAAELASKGA